MFIQKISSPLLVLSVLSGCGEAEGGGAGGEIVSCDSLPTCFTDGFDELMACVDSSSGTLGSVSESSGVISGLECTAGETTIAFSAFSSRPNGTTPLPSTITFSQGGTQCAELSTSEGKSTSGRETRSFESVTVKRPDAPQVKLRVYDDGSVSLECGSREATETFKFSAGALDDCADELPLYRAFRDEEVTEVGVAVEGESALFTCN